MALYQSELIKVIKYLRTYVNTDSSILMLGVQKILIDYDSFEKSINRIGITYDEVLWSDIKNGNKKTIDTFQFFKVFGYNDVHALDISNYEGADILLDLNEKLPDKHRTFDFVMNIGTLEHVYNVATAMKSICELTKRGGYILNIGPAAGYVDHGFFSFSPAFFEDFYFENGYETIDLFLEMINDQKPYEEWRSYYSEDCRIFDGWPGEMGLQVYLDRICKKEEIGRVQIWCLAKKAQKGKLSFPIQRIYR